MGNGCGSLSSPVRPDANPTQQFAVQVVSYMVVHRIAKANMRALALEKVTFGEYFKAKAMLDPSPATWPRMGSSCGTWPFRQVADSLRDNPNYSAPGRRSTRATQTTSQAYTVFLCIPFLSLLTHLIPITFATKHPFALVRPHIFDKRTPENELHTCDGRPQHGQERPANAREEAGQVQQLVA